MSFSDPLRTRHQSPTYHSFCPGYRANNTNARYPLAHKITCMLNYAQCPIQQYPEIKMHNNMQFPPKYK